MYQRERHIDARAAAKVLADIETAKARERRQRLALKLREEMMKKELSLPYDRVGYAFDVDDPRVVGYARVYCVCVCVCACVGVYVCMYVCVCAVCVCARAFCVVRTWHLFVRGLCPLECVHVYAHMHPHVFTRCMVLRLRCSCVLARTVSMWMCTRGEVVDEPPYDAAWRYN